MRVTSAGVRSVVFPERINRKLDEAISKPGPHMFSRGTHAPSCRSLLRSSS